MTSSAEHNPFVVPRAALADSQMPADGQFSLNLLSPDGRIGRVRYVGYSIGLSMPIMLVGGGLGALVSPAMFVLAYVAMLYVSIMLAIKRSHDFNTTGWASLLVFVPLINFIFLFIPGTDGPNRFGNKTAPNGKTGTILIVALIGIAVVGILAAVAIPAYQQYAQRAQSAQLR